MVLGLASDLMSKLTWVFNRWVGAWCMSLAAPSVAQLEVFFSSYYLILTYLLAPTSRTVYVLLKETDKNDWNFEPQIAFSG